MVKLEPKNFAYLPVPDVVSRLGLYVTGAGWDQVPPESQYPRELHPELYDFTWRAGRVLPEYQFLFISEGEGEFESHETGLQKIETGTLIMMFPDVWHRYRPSRTAGWTEFWISVGGELMFEWHNRELFSVDQPLTKLNRPIETMKRYRKLVDFAINNPAQHPPLLSALALSIITSAIEQAPLSLTTDDAPSDEADSVGEIVTAAMRLIWNHSHQRISVDLIAKQLGITRRTLERRFRDQGGRTVQQELIACRMQRAKRLLGQTHVPIKYVAFAAGFSSLSNLCKVFQRELGITPGQYRDSLTIAGKKNNRRSNVG